MVSLFERRVILYRDKGLTGYLDESQIKEIISKMMPALKKQRIREALETGLSELAVVLEASGLIGKSDNELENRIIEEEGI